MRQSQMFIPTLRDVPNDAEAKSHQLMLRAGLVRQIVSGVYAFLPLGQKVLNVIQKIIREEMAKVGAVELLLPSIQPEELFIESGRLDLYGPDLVKFKDRNNRNLVLGPTHEELITKIVTAEINSYKKLPICLYQIQTKFRDEKRPRFGILRTKEFIMKDAYSFHASKENLDSTYQKIYDAYISIFERCGLNFRVVEADSGAMGGTDTHEFMALSDIGEDTIVYSNESNYIANIEKAPVTIRQYEQDIPKKHNTIEEIYTPRFKTVEEIVEGLNLKLKNIIKTVAFESNGSPIIALVRGDYDINEVKLKNILGVDKIELLSENKSINELKSIPGFIGPIG